MRIQPGPKRTRIEIIPENSAERELAQDVFIGLNTDRVPWTADNCLLNHVALEECFDVPRDTLLLSTTPPDDPRLLWYQVEDVRTTLHLNTVLNANPMGYGKTVEALQWCKIKGFRNILVVCPKSTRYQWRTAVWEWYDPELEVIVTPLTLKWPAPKEGRVVVTNYEQLLHNGSYQGGEWDCIIADEAHRIRNAKAKTSIAMRNLRCKAKQGLTGTPIMNHPDDLWGICLWLNPTYLGGSYWNFVNLYCKLKEDFWGKKIVGATENILRKTVLKSTLDQFWIRNPQNLLGVGLRESSVDLEMYPSQRVLYDQVRDLAIEELDKVGISIANGMAQLMKLQQLTSDPCSFKTYVGGNIKFEWILDLLNDNPELKVCVFSKFKRAILALNALMGESVATIHGDVSATMREANKQRFINEPTVRVMTGTIGAMAEGIDGLQHVCHTVIFLDRAWNPEENNQAIARVARMGQEYIVNVYMLDCIGTIDEHVGKVNLLKMTDIKELIWRRS